MVRMIVVGWAHCGPNVPDAPKSQDTSAVGKEMRE